RADYDNHFPEDTLDNPTFELNPEESLHLPEDTHERQAIERLPEETQDNPPYQPVSRGRAAEPFPDETQENPPYQPVRERASQFFPDETQENPPYQPVEPRRVNRFPEDTQDVEPYQAGAAPALDDSFPDERDYQSRTFPPRHGLAKGIEADNTWSTSSNSGAGQDSWLSTKITGEMQRIAEAEESSSSLKRYHQFDEEFQLGESIYELEPMSPDQLLYLSPTQIEESDRLVEQDRRTWSHPAEESHSYGSTQAAHAPTVTEAPPEDIYIDYILADKYQILSKVGAGATAKVYKARQLASGRIVAIKILKDSSPQAIVEGFEQEIVTHSKLNHKNIVEFIERLTNPAGDVFLVMENIRGISLQEIIRVHGPILKEDYIWKIVSQMCDALEHAHRRGIIHRDLKSANVILAKQDKQEMVVKILDFGLAIREWVSQSISQGFTAGSPLFMSPEQCRGNELTPRSDLYSLGIIIYEMLTGSTPFTGKNFSEVMASHCNPNVTATPLSTVVPELKGANQLDQIMSKLLKVREGERFQDAAKLRDAFAYWYQSVKDDDYDRLIPEDLFREQSSVFNFSTPSSLATTVLLRNMGETADDQSRANRPRLNREKLIYKQAYKSAVRQLAILILLLVAISSAGLFYLKQRGAHPRPQKPATISPNSAPARGTSP
ncbi:MAG: serine/threonine protein kinase, partial [Cyanobacteria bacterium]|nr:serine/threonine protein kinase [Cyanobacteriota bacterium]